MVRNRRQWVIGILFWIVFLASIWLGLEGRYEWIDKAWAFVRLGILAAVSILMVVEFNRARKGPREYFFDRGVWRFVAAFFIGLFSGIRPRSGSWGGSVSVERFKNSIACSAETQGQVTPSASETPAG